MKLGRLSRGLFALTMLSAFAGAGSALAHNGVKLEQDECVLKIGPETLHFSAYQRVGEEEEFCEDIAKTGPTVIALSAVSPDVRDMAIGIRVVKDVDEQQEKSNIDAVTVAYVEPKVYSNGIMTFEHNFKDAGHYVGIVTVSDDQGSQWVSRFPFSVGLYTFWNMIEYILYAIGFVSLSGLLWFLVWHRAHKARKMEPLPQA